MQPNGAPPLVKLVSTGLTRRVVRTVGAGSGVCTLWATRVVAGGLS
jgi:hypothetical protein